MGRGLAAILSSPEGAEAAGELRALPIDEIEPNPDQPRRRIDPDGLASLAESLKARGVLQPVLVRPRAGRHELIAGERRWRAARRGGRRPALRPDQGAAGAYVAEALGTLLGRDVRVRPQGAGYRVELDFESPDEALQLVARLSSRRAA